MVITSPHDLGVCPKTLGNWAEDFYAGIRIKTPAFWIRMAIKSRLPLVNGENSLRPPEKQLRSEQGFSLKAGLCCLFDKNFLQYFPVLTF